jgi:hypothetical protein
VIRHKSLEITIIYIDLFNLLLAGYNLKANILISEP